MNKILKIVVALLALVFASIGFRWLVAPEGVAAEFGMTLMQGLGLSSQIGDLGAFFLSLAIFILLALTTGRRTWYYPPIILLGLTAIMRTMAWMFHDASLAVDMIAVEIIACVVLYLGSLRLADED
ncbi:hypothetical protein N9R59_01315 [Porticoccaceae bacterium]|jgi:uncharacterized membrane protein|nr:hypothetical protein [Porticoccaceae bacterium]MCT2532031.1 hypothetical protein [SAR92 clade bacterium H231]MDA7753306.1 hypothetical protein [bacterium]MBT6319819.1 hypothetical protein [Porticoccaceae bacterium]MBT7258747.1 hypothetical protein [Porticoccaceae bacterium]